MSEPGSREQHRGDLSASEFSDAELERDEAGAEAAEAAEGHGVPQQAETSEAESAATDPEMTPAQGTMPQAATAQAHEPRTGEQLNEELNTESDYSERENTESMDPAEDGAERTRAAQPTYVAPAGDAEGITPDRSPTVRPRRSALYMPGANERALEKAKTLPSDVLIFDLEDAVTPAVKAEARERVCAAAASGEYGDREVIIRVNSVETEWHDADLREAAGAGPSAVLVPKVNSAREVQNIERALELAAAPEHTKIWAMLETPTAILRAEEIAGASERLVVLVLGTNDLANELHAVPVSGRVPLIASLSQAVLAARATGTAILDGVYNNVGDPQGFEAECHQGRQLGFDGKTLIHPNQLEACNRVFAPSHDEVEQARKIINAFEQARAEGKGVATVDGRMVENLHVDYAMRMLNLHAAIGELEGQSTRD